MKKLIFSLIATIAIATGLTSCQDEGNEPVIPAQDAIEATFPKGARKAKVKVTTPTELRTRAGESTDFDLPLWDPFSAGELQVQYAVYTEDGELFYQTPSSLAYTSTSFDLTVPVPDTNTGKIWVFARKKGSDLVADWENKSIQYVGAMSASIANMGKLGEAWLGGTTGDFSEGLSVTLIRPLVQISVLTDELSIPGIAERFKDGISTTIGFRNNQDQTGPFGFLPNKFYFEDLKLEFVQTNNRDWYFNTNPRTADGTYYGTINGRKMEYLANFYVLGKFASAVEDYKDGSTETSYNYLQLTIKNADGYEKYISLGDVHSYMRVNNRIVIYPKNAPGAEGSDGSSSGGILSSNSNVAVSINEDFTGGGSITVD